MQKHLLIVLLVFYTSLLFSQAKKNIGGQDLYQKGSCERVSAKFVSCTYCTDKELKNCKEYWCTDDGTCTEAPFKKNGDQLEAKESNEVKIAEPKKIDTTRTWGRFETKDTTSKLPKGLLINKGHVTLRSGYTSKPSSNGNFMFIIAPGGGNNISGGYSCGCSGGDEGGCTLIVNPQQLTCLGGCGSGGSCKLIVTMGDGVVNAAMLEKKPLSPASGWRVFVMPSKRN